MTKLVLDASVAIKWALPGPAEPLTAEATELLARYTTRGVALIVPDVFWAEIANVLWKGVRQRRWSKSMAESTASDMLDRHFVTVSSQALLTEALTISLAYDRSVYDCLYLALAVQSRCSMITADEKLANAVAAHLPVKWLGAFSI